MAENEFYVVGCGPSMKNFPWEILSGLPTIAVNGAIIDLPNPKIFLTACSAFARLAYRNDFWNTKAHKVLVMGETHKNYNRVKPFISLFDEVRAPVRFDGQLGFDWDSFATGKNSGFCAMQYAALQGATIIRLVGFDLNGQGHHYNVGGPSKNVLELFYGHFVTGIKILQNRGVRVISHTKGSRLNRHIPYEELA